MRVFIATLTLCCGLLAVERSAEAAVDVHIDLSTERMTVHSGGKTYVWPVSTARSGYVTPRGTFHPQSLQLMHHSRKYDNAPMPHSIFFRGGYAIHGTYEGHLGRPASHGCVRLSPGNAATLYSLVQSQGATISISGAPHTGHGEESRPERHHVAAVHRHEPVFAPEWRANSEPGLFGF